jgi:hypothetical protein
MILVLSEGPRASAKLSTSLVSADEPQYAATADSGDWNAMATANTIVALTALPELLMSGPSNVRNGAAVILCRRYRPISLGRRSRDAAGGCSESRRLAYSVFGASGCEGAIVEKIAVAGRCS